MPRTTKTELLPSDNVVTLPPSDLAGPPAVAEEKMTETPHNAAERPSEAPATLVERLRAQQQAESADLEIQWQNIVRAVADENADDDQVSAVLYATGRSISDLEKSVSGRRRINRLESLVAELPAAQSEQVAAQTAFNALRVAQKLQAEQMAIEFSAARGVLTTAICRWQSAKNAEHDLFLMANPPSNAPIPQWGNVFEPHPAIAKQLLVEERVNKQIREEIARKTGREPQTGSYSGSGVTPASRT